MCVETVDTWEISVPSQVFVFVFVFVLESLEILNKI